MRINYCLGFGIILALIGASLLVAFGLLYVKPYVYIRHMEQSICAMSHSEYANEYVKCTCTTDGSSSCLSHYPCIKVLVNFSVENGESVINATLYDSYETYTLQKNALQCSYHRCDRIKVYNDQAVRSFIEIYGSTGVSFFCYYDPYDHSYAILEVVTMSTAIHCIFWPVVSLISGLAIVLVFVFCYDGKGHHDGRQLQFPSIERRLAQITVRTAAQSGESSHSEKLVPSQHCVSETNDVN